MGIENNSIRLLNKCKRDGVDFRKTLLIGRQEIIISERNFRKAIESVGVSMPEQDIQRIFSSKPFYSEPFFKALGAEQVDSIDFSDYENATLVHDMNDPVAEKLNNLYTCVFDGGTLEHVFNYPVAIANAMAMVKEGGHLILITPANNMMGHGFYQFSPELFFRIFTADNGYAAPQIWLFDMLNGTPFYKVKDPDEIKGRVMLRNDEMVLMAVVAKKVTHQLPFKKAPLQSDYLRTWTDGISSNKKNRSLKNTLQKIIPAFLFNPLYESFIDHKNKPKWGYIKAYFTKDDF